MYNIGINYINKSYINISLNFLKELNINFYFINGE